MVGYALRLALSFIKAAGWRKLITLLALTAVFAATFVGYVSANAAERNALDWYLGTVFPDYDLDLSQFPSSFFQNVSAGIANLSLDATNISKALLAVPYVISAGPYLQGNFVSFENLSYNQPLSGALEFQTAAMFEAQQVNYVDRMVAGTGDLGPSGVLVPVNVARADNLSVGRRLPLYMSSFFTSGNCTISCTPEPGYVNVTVEGIYEPKPGPAAYLFNVFQWSFSRFTAPVIMNLSTLSALVPAIVPSSSLPFQQLRYDVLVARGAVLDPLDTAGNAKRLGALRTQMFFVANKYGLGLYSSLENAYDHFLQDRTYLDLTVLFAVAPIVLVAVVFGILMETAETALRYRDLSVARSRGVGLRRLRRALWLEAIVETCLGSLLGFGGGLITALLLVPGAGAVLLPIALVAVAVPSVLCLCIAFGMKALTVRGLAKRAIVEGLGRQTDGVTAREVTGRVTLVSLAIGGALLGVSWFSNAPLLNVPQASVLLFGTARDWLLSLSFLAFLATVCMNAPRITNRIGRRRLRSRDARDAQTLYGSTLVRSKRSPDPVVLLVAALVLSASVLTFGLVSLQRTSVENETYGETGSDLLLLLPGNPFGGSGGVNNPPIAAYLAVPGVADLSFASAAPSAAGFSVVLVNSSTYLDTIRTDKLTYGGTLARALQSFTHPGAVIVNDAFVQATGLGAGSAFGNLTVTGVVPRMPGLQQRDQIDSPTVFTDYRNYGLTPNQTDIRWVLVRLAPGADPSIVGTELTSLFSLAFVRDAAEEVSGIDASPLFGALGTLWQVDLGTFAFLLLVALGGYAVRIRVELENDFARMRARGLPARSVTRQVMALVMFTVIASLLWGLGLGELLLFSMATVTGSAGGPALGGLLVPGLPIILLMAVFAVAALALALALARGFEQLSLGPRLRERIV